MYASGAMPPALMLSIMGGADGSAGNADEPLDDHTLSMFAPPHAA